MHMGNVDVHGALGNADGAMSPLTSTVSSPTSTISSPTSAMEEALAADVGLTAVLEEAALKGRCTQKRSPLLLDSELATIDLRFAVGDKVRCCIAKDEFEDGTVVRRWYREEEWPSGHYAAVRTMRQAYVGSIKPVGSVKPNSRSVPLAVPSAVGPLRGRRLFASLCTALS